MAALTSPLTRLSHSIVPSRSVRTFADAFLAHGLPLHCLINNAGLGLPHEAHTEDGFETTIGERVAGPNRVTGWVGGCADAKRLLGSLPWNPSATAATCRGTLILPHRPSLAASCTPPPTRSAPTHAGVNFYSHLLLTHLLLPNLKQSAPARQAAELGLAAGLSNSKDRGSEEDGGWMEGVRSTLECLHAACPALTSGPDLRPLRHRVVFMSSPEESRGFIPWDDMKGTAVEKSDFNWWAGRHPSRIAASLLLQVHARTVPSTCPVAVSLSK